MPDSPYLLKSVHDEFALRMDEHHQTQDRQISELEKKIKDISDLTLSVASLATSVEQMAKAQVEHNKRLETLESRDGEKWRSVVGYIITFIVGVILTYISSKLGIN